MVRGLADPAEVEAYRPGLLRAAPKGRDLVRPAGRSGEIEPPTAPRRRWAGFAVAAAAATGVDAEVIDVRSISPLDVDTLSESVKKTGRCIVAHEATRFGGYGAELAARIQKECFWHLEAPIARIAGWDTPYPHAFEWQYFPGKKRLVAGIRSMMEVE